jgi:DNA-binding XRE family transcriptional regulator
MKNGTRRLIEQLQEQRRWLRTMLSDNLARSSAQLRSLLYSLHSTAPVGYMRHNCPSYGQYLVLFNILGLPLVQTRVRYGKVATTRLSKKLDKHTNISYRTWSYRLGLSLYRVAHNLTGYTRMSSSFSSNRSKGKTVIGYVGISSDDYSEAEEAVMPKPMLKSLQEHEDLILYQQSEEESRAVWTIGQQIRELRKTSGYRRADLAQKLGIALEVLVVVENGGGDLETATNVWNAIQRLDIDK